MQLVNCLSNLVQAYLNGILKFFTGLEFYNIAGLDFNRLTGLRITTLACFLAGFHEGAESHQRDLAVFFLQGLGDIGHKRIQNCAGGNFGNFSIFE